MTTEAVSVNLKPAPICPDVIARVFFFLTSEGGRQGPTPSDSLSCIFGFGGRFYDCRLLLEEVGSLWPGQEAVVPIKFLFPELIKHRLKIGDRFYLRDYRKIAEGEIQELR
jgi:hypothetical protein